MTQPAVPVELTSPTPVPVEITGPTPVPVEIVAGGSGPKAPPPSARVQEQDRDPSLPARTTFQEDLVVAGQRRINLIWEWTQAAIAVSVVLTTMVAGIYSMVVPTVTVGAGAAQVQVPVQIPTLIGVAFGMVTGFYFSRTNHEKIGGTGPKVPAYSGR